jgi:hypothetical protein
MDIHKNARLTVHGRERIVRQVMSGQTPKTAAAALDADIFVPGHSSLPADPKQSRQEFFRYRQMLVDVRDAIQQAITRGLTEDQAVAMIQWPQYEKLRGYETQRPLGIRRLYRQLTGVLP